MAGKSSKSNNRGTDLFGYFVSGKFKEYHTNQFAPNTGGGGGTGLTASGGVISDYTDGPAVYRAHIFTSSGTFNVTDVGSFGSNIEYLVVAGGGGGGGQHGGGGGAGGLRTNLSGHPLAGSEFPVSTSPGSYTVTVGGGGSKQIGGPYPYTKNSTSGGDSAFGPITSHGGGTGGNWYNASSYSQDRQKGSAGGSGGGSGSNEGDTQAPEAYRGAGNTPSQSPPQGNPGGRGRYGGGGGGGAGAAASPNPPASPYGAGYGADGGIGVQVLIAGPSTNTGVGQTQGWFAGGGGGGSYNSAPNPNYSDDNRPRGGVGGGGKGGFEPDGSAPDANGENAEISTGGGGGGGGMAARNGGAGGSGIVVVRYQIAELTATAKATGGAISFYGDKTIHTFTSSGDFNAPASISDVEYVCIGGGGAGGTRTGGGGGAGGYVTATGQTIASGPWPIVIGAGGSKVDDNSNNPASPGNTGSNTVASFPGGTITAGYGGGGAGGGSLWPQSAQTAPLGSGGGGCGGTVSTPTQGGPGGPQGYPAGPGNTNAAAYGGGGGGGAGGSGGAGATFAPPYQYGRGGYGVQLPSTFRNPDSTPQPGIGNAGGLGAVGPGPKSSGPNPGLFWVAGGGGGGDETNPQPQYYGAGGGGSDQTSEPPLSPNATPHAGAGSGGDSGTKIGEDAIQNTGSGGGGGGHDAGYRTSGNGGSGLVLIAYPS